MADANIQGQVEYLAESIQSIDWADLWQRLALRFIVSRKSGSRHHFKGITHFLNMRASRT